MKEPTLGRNATQSFIDFDSSGTKVRLGAQEGQLFVEIAETKWFITSTAGATLADVISERTAATGVTIDGVKLKDKMITIDNALGTATMKVHAHSLGVTQEYANEFKGEFLSTGGVGEAATCDGIAAHYHMAASSIGVMRSIIGVAYLDAGKTLSGTLATGSWMSGGLFAADVAGTAVLNGTAVIVTGLWSQVSSAANSTMTAVNHIAALSAAGKLLTKPVSGECSILYLSQEAGATTINQAIYIAGGAKIDAFATIDVAASGKAVEVLAKKLDDTNTSHALHIKVGSANGYIPVYVNKWNT
jgi:hypothetical protein